jgi:hypothetical protein
MRNRAQEFHKWLARLSGIDADNQINVSDAKDLKRASSIKVCGEVVCGMGVVERIVPLQAATVEPRKHLGWTVEIRRHRLTVTAASIRAITIGLLSIIVSFLFWADRALTREILFAV